MISFYLQDGETLLCRCTAVIPTEVVLKTDGVEYSLSNKGIYIHLRAICGWAWKYFGSVFLLFCFVLVRLAEKETHSLQPGSHVWRKGKEIHVEITVTQMRTAQAQASTQEIEFFHFLPLSFALVHSTQVNRDNANANGIVRHLGKDLHCACVSYRPCVCVQNVNVTCIRLARVNQAYVTFQYSPFNGVCFCVYTGANYLYLPCRALIGSLRCLHWLWLVGVVYFVLALFTRYL